MSVCLDNSLRSIRQAVFAYDNDGDGIPNMQDLHVNLNANLDDDNDGIEAVLIIVVTHGTASSWILITMESVMLVITILMAIMFPTRFR